MEQEHWDRELEQFRALLRLLARQNIHPRLWKDVDPSGVVQDTLVHAHRDREQFKGEGPAALKAWLCAILMHRIQDAIKKARAGRRDVDRNVPMEAAFGETTRRVEKQLACRDASPSQIAMKNEDVLALAAALERLEPAQREAIEFHHLQGRSLSETAQLLGRTPSAAAALLHRALVRLKEHLKKG